MVLRGAGLIARPASSNDVSLRVEAVAGTLNRMVEGQSGILVDYRCKELIKGFEGGYGYKRMQVSGERYDDKPDKNRFSHIHDALQYLMLGGGEGRKVLNNQKQAEAFTIKRDFDIFTRQPKRQAPRLWSR